MKMRDALAIVVMILLIAIAAVSAEARRQRMRADMYHDGYLEMIAEVKKLQKENQDLRDLVD